MTSPSFTTTIQCRTAHSMKVILGAVLGFAALGCGTERSCQSSCFKLAGCSHLSVSGYASCSDSCTGTDADCAACVNTTPCADLAVSRCGSACPGVTFSSR